MQFKHIECQISDYPGVFVAWDTTPEELETAVNTLHQFIENVHQLPETSIAYVPAREWIPNTPLTGDKFVRLKLTTELKVTSTTLLHLKVFQEDRLVFWYTTQQATEMTNHEI